MRMPATVVSSTLHDTLGWPDVTIVSDDGVDARLKAESDVPLRSQGGTQELVYHPTLRP